jgi:hypothetical protein
MTQPQKDYIRDWNYQRITWIRQERKKGVSIRELVIRFGADLVDRALNVKYI